jgi:hypothetical protein
LGGENWKTLYFIARNTLGSVNLRIASTVNLRIAGTPRADPEEIMIHVNQMDGSQPQHRQSALEVPSRLFRVARPGLPTAQLLEPTQAVRPSTTASASIVLGLDLLGSSRDRR